MYFVYLMSYFPNDVFFNKAFCPSLICFSSISTHFVNASSCRDHSAEICSCECQKVIGGNKLAGLTANVVKNISISEKSFLTESRRDL